LRASLQPFRKQRSRQIPAVLSVVRRVVMYQHVLLAVGMVGLQSIHLPAEGPQGMVLAEAEVARHVASGVDKPGGLAMAVEEGDAAAVSSRGQVTGRDGNRSVRVHGKTDRGSLLAGIRYPEFGCQHREPFRRIQADRTAFQKVQIAVLEPGDELVTEQRSLGRNLPNGLALGEYTQCERK